MKRLYNVEYNGVAIDYLYQEDVKSYGVYPSMFYQRGNTPSDISNKIPFFSSFKHKDKYFRAVEWYAVNINIAIKGLLILLLVVLLILVIYFGYHLILTP